VAPGRLAVLSGLMERLAAVSREDEGGGRVLIEPCDLVITETERILLFEAIRATSWRPEVRLAGTFTTDC
jgi:hypothetical protein